MAIVYYHKEVVTWISSIITQKLLGGYHMIIVYCINIVTYSLFHRVTFQGYHIFSPHYFRVGFVLIICYASIYTLPDFSIVRLSMTCAMDRSGSAKRMTNMKCRTKQCSAYSDDTNQMVNLVSFPLYHPQKLNPHTHFINTALYCGVPFKCVIAVPALFVNHTYIRIKKFIEILLLPAVWQILHLE